MKKVFIFPFLSILFLTIMIGKAQNENGGIPYSFSAKRLSMNIPQMELASVDHAALLKEDAAQERNSPLRISVHQTLNYTMKNAGRLDVLDDGSKLWRVNIKSPNAYALYLHFSSFEIPKGASLFAYSPDQQFVRGKYTHKNEGEDFYVLDIPGDEIIVEYYEPAGAAFEGHFEIVDVGHLYRNVLTSKGGLGDASGNCHINVVCPEVQEWLDQANSVVCILILVQGNGFLCTGALINNTRYDKRPYVYTAAHCYKSNATWVFYFDYKSSSCNSNSDNSKGTEVRGGVVRAVDFEGSETTLAGMVKGPDFMLLEITGTFPNAIRDRLYFAGWDLSTSAPSVGAAIHHPAGDFKKFSKPATVISYSSPSSYYWQTNWIKGAENKGVTEVGSSGSPLFNAEGYIVGHLSRGLSYCENQQINGTSQPDYYGKTTSSWTFKSDSATQLKYWLDPDDKGLTKLSGIYYSQDPPLENVIKEQNGFTVNLYPNPTTGTVKINGNFNGEVIQCNIYSILGALVYQENVTASDEFELKLDLMNGVYFIELQGIQKKTTQKLLIFK